MLTHSLNARVTSCYFYTSRLDTTADILQEVAPNVTLAQDRSRFRLCVYTSAIPAYPARISPVRPNEIGN